MVNNIEKREEYQNLVSQKLEIEAEPKEWKEVKEIITDAATEIVGLEAIQSKRNKQDKLIAKLSKKQKEIRVKISNTKIPEEITELRQERNRILKSIKKRLKQINEEEIDKVCNEINTANNDQRFFKAVKQIRSTKNKKNSVVIE